MNNPTRPLTDPRAKEYDLALADYSDQLAALDEGRARWFAERDYRVAAAGSAGSARALRSKATHLRARWT